jgi:hypothetical protein
VEFIDSVVTCCRCGSEFLLTAGPYDAPPRRDLRPILRWLLIAGLLALVGGCVGGCYLFQIVSLFVS